MVFTVVTMTVKSFAGNWVDIGPGADDGQVTWCRAGLGRALIAPRGWESNMSSHQCPVSQPSSVPVSSWAAPGGPGCHLAATHTAQVCFH